MRTQCEILMHKIACVFVAIVVAAGVSLQPTANQQTATTQITGHVNTQRKKRLKLRLSVCGSSKISFRPCKIHQQRNKAENNDSFEQQNFEYPSLEGKIEIEVGTDKLKSIKCTSISISILKNYTIFLLTDPFTIYEILNPKWKYPTKGYVKGLKLGNCNSLAMKFSTCRQCVDCSRFSRATKSDKLESKQKFV